MQDSGINWPSVLNKYVHDSLPYKFSIIFSFGNRRVVYIGITVLQITIFNWTKYNKQLFEGSEEQQGRFQSWEEENPHSLGEIHVYLGFPKSHS